MLIKGLLDIPDQVVFSEAPVRICASKTLLVRNIGDAAAKFKFQCDNPFSVSPDNGGLGANDSMQLEIKFHPTVKYRFM
jgi:hypothetical protein